MLRLRRKRKTETALALADRARDGGDWGGAARHYREVLAREPGNPAIWVQYGHALKESGNIADAEQAYRKSLALDGQAADTHLQLGHVLKLQGRREDAAAAYFRALALERASSPAAGELLTLCWERIGLSSEPITRLDANWRQHAPALLNCVASVNALAHEQARLTREIEALRREVAALGQGDSRPTRTDDRAPAAAGALPERK